MVKQLYQMAMHDDGKNGRNGGERDGFQGEARERHGGGRSGRHLDGASDVRQGGPNGGRGGASGGHTGRLIGRLRGIIEAHVRIDDAALPLAGGGELSPREVRCLRAVGRAEGANVKAVGARLGVTRSAASQMVAKLAARGLAAKGRAEGNDKEVLVSLTAPGREALRAHEAFHERHMDALRERLAAFSPEERRAVERFLSVAEETMRLRMREMFGE